MVNIPEADQIPEDRNDISDPTPNRDTTDMKVEIDPREEEISHLEVEDSEPHRVSQDSSEVEAKMKETSQSKGESHHWKLK